MAAGTRGETTALVVGGGFAGIACAKRLSKHGVQVILVDKHDYTQFQPLLYQVATAQVNVTDVARPIRQVFRKRDGVSVRVANVVEHRSVHQDGDQCGRHFDVGRLLGAGHGFATEFLQHAWC